MELEVAKPVRSEPHRELLLDLQIVTIIIVQREEEFEQIWDAI